MKTLKVLGVLAFGILWWHGCASVQDAKLPVMGYAESRPDSTAIQKVDRQKAKRGSSISRNDSSDALDQRIILMPLRDRSKYKGPWYVSTSMAASLAEVLANNEFFQVLPVDTTWSSLDEKGLDGKFDISQALEIGRQLEADLVITGEIEALSMKRFRATVPIGGYRNYKALVTVDLKVWKVIDGRTAGQTRAEIEHDSPRYGITNPAAHVPLDREYYFLGETPWGTEEFHKTLVGAGVDLCLQKLSENLGELIQPPPDPTVSEPKIVDIAGEQAYINIGILHEVKNGHKYGIWDNGRELRDPQTDEFLGRALPRRVGVVQVEQVLTDKLSIVRILEGLDEIEAGFNIRAE